MTSTLLKKYDFDTVFDSQKVFRRILEAMSNPGRIVQADGILSVAMTLLDNEVSFHVCGSPDLSEEIVSLTLAGREAVETADYIFVCDRDGIISAVKNAKCGTLTDPHKSATVIIIDNGESDCRVTLRGPGIKGQTEFMVSKVVIDTVATRDAQHYEYPQGIDFLFISGAGDLLAIPRLTRMEVR